MARSHSRSPHQRHKAQRNGRASVNGAVPRRKVVLVVEDYASVGGLIAGILRQEGYRALRAWDPQEAARIARGRRPDLIVLDLNVSQEQRSVIHELCADEATRRSPMVAVVGSGAALSSDDQRYVTEILDKPFDIDVMLNAVRKALGEPLVDLPPRQYDAQDQFLHGY